MKQVAIAALMLTLSVTATAGEGHKGKIVKSSMGDTIRVKDAPNGARLRTMGGDIIIKSASGSVVAKTMGGNIEVDRIDGSLDAGTMGGNVDIGVVGSATGRDIEITSMGGEIEVTFPADFEGDFYVKLERDEDDSSTEIVSDFPLQIKEKTTKHFFQDRTTLTGIGKSGAGGNRVRITTFGGNITLRKR